MKLHRSYQNCFLLAALFLFGLNTKAQTTAKIYTNYTYTTDLVYGARTGANNDSFITTNSRTTNINILPAIKFSKDNVLYTEFALANFSIKQNDDIEWLSVNNNKTTISGLRNTQTVISLRTEFGKKVNAFGADSKFGLDLGVANTYSYFKLKIDPKVSNSFPYRVVQGGLDFAFVPRLSYDLNNKFAIEASTLLSLAEISVESTRIENPAVSLNEQTTGNLLIEVLPSRFIFRLGVAYKL